MRQACLLTPVLDPPPTAAAMQEALANIADTTCENLACALLGRPLSNEVLA